MKSSNSWSSDPEKEEVWPKNDHNGFSEALDWNLDQVVPQWIQKSRSPVMRTSKTNLVFKIDFDNSVQNNNKFSNFRSSKQWDNNLKDGKILNRILNFLKQIDFSNTSVNASFNVAIGFSKSNNFLSPVNWSK